MRNKTQVTSFSVAAGGDHPQLFISDKFSIVNGDVIFLQYRADAPGNAMI